MVTATGRAMAIELYTFNVALLFSHVDGVQQDPQPYDLELGTCAEPIIGVVVSTPGGTDVPLVRDPDSSICWFSGSDNPTFETAQLGTYVFRFMGASESLTVSLDLDVASPTGIAQITFPEHNATGVDLDPVLSWESVIGLGGDIEVNIVGPPPDFEEVPFTNLPISATEWDPWDPNDPDDTLEPGTNYSFEIDVEHLKNTQTFDAGDPNDVFIYTRAFSYRNEVDFTTVADTDVDGVVDPDDNCPFVANPSQSNTFPPSAGDACQCGDVDVDRDVDEVDGFFVRSHLIDSPQPGFDLSRCSVSGGAATCDILDAVLIERFAAGVPAPFENGCAAAGS